ncbi:MAG: hypothetical protein ACK5AT_26370, partial [Bradyrhizobium sp.]
MAEHSPSSSPATFADAAPAPPGSQVTITERADLGLATLQARKGQEAALRACSVASPRSARSVIVTWLPGGAGAASANVAGDDDG